MYGCGRVKKLMIIIKVENLSQFDPVTDSDNNLSEF